MSNRQRAVLIGVLILLLLVVVLVGSSLFTVDEREVAVVLQFGEPVASYTEPGLKFKVPFVQEVRRLPKTYQFSLGPGGRVLEDLPTADGKKIEVTAWTIWRITDPERFVRVLRNVETAELRVADFVRGVMRNVITSNELAEVVRSTDRDLTYPVLTDLLRVVEEGADQTEPEPQAAKDAPPEPDDAGNEDQQDEEEESLQKWLRTQIETKQKIQVGREKIVEMIYQLVQRRLAEIGDEQEGARGIKLVDVGIVKIDFVAAVRDKAFERQIARWESIAAFYVNQGEKQKQEILNRTQAKVEEILGEGSKQANETRGEVDARIIEAYAKAIEETGDFYNFIRTLEAYKEAMGGNTRLVLTTDSEMFKLLKTIPPIPPLAPPETSADEAKPDESPPSKTPAKNTLPESES